MRRFLVAGWAIVMFGMFAPTLVQGQSARVDFARQLIWSEVQSSQAVTPRTLAERTLIAQVLRLNPSEAERVANARVIAVLSKIEPGERSAIVASLRNNQVTPAQRAQLARALHRGDSDTEDLLPVLKNSLTVTRPESIPQTDLRRFLAPDPVPSIAAPPNSQGRARQQSARFELARLLLIDERVSPDQRVEIVRQLASAQPLQAATRRTLLDLVEPTRELLIAAAASQLSEGSQELVTRWLLLNDSKLTELSGQAPQIEKGSLSEDTFSNIVPKARRFSPREGQSLLRSLAAGSGLSEEQRIDLAETVGFPQSAIAEAQLQNATAGQDGEAEAGENGDGQSGRSSSSGFVSRIGSAGGNTPGARASRPLTSSTPATNNASRPNASQSPSGRTGVAQDRDAFTRRDQQMQAQRNLTDRMAIAARDSSTRPDQFAANATRLQFLADDLREANNQQADTGESRLVRAFDRLGGVTSGVQPSDPSLAPMMSRLGIQLKETSAAIQSLAFAGANPPTLRLDTASDQLLTTLDLAGRINQTGDRLTSAEQNFIGRVLMITEVASAELIAGHLLLEDQSRDLARRANSLADDAQQTLKQAPQDTRQLLASTAGSATVLANEYRRWAAMLPSDARASAQRVAQEFDSLALAADNLADDQRDLTAGSVATLSSQLNRVVEACAALAPYLAPTLRRVQQQVVNALKSGGTDTTPEAILARIEQGAERGLRELAEVNGALDQRAARLVRALTGLADALQANPALNKAGQGVGLKRRLISELLAAAEALKSQVSGVGNGLKNLPQRLDNIVKHCDELAALVSGAVRPQIQFVGEAVGHLRETVRSAPQLAQQGKAVLTHKLDQAANELRVAHRILALATGTSPQERLDRAAQSLRRLLQTLPTQSDAARKLKRLAGLLDTPVKELTANKARLASALREVEGSLRADLQLRLQQHAGVRLERQTLALELQVALSAASRRLGVPSTDLVRLQGQLAAGEQLNRPSLQLAARLAVLENEAGRPAQLQGMVHEAFARRIGLDPITGPVLSQRPPQSLMEPVLQARRLAVEGQVWVPGYWSWNTAGAYVWVTGALRNPPEGRSWLPGRWVEEQGAFRRIPGAWIDPKTVLRIAGLPPRSLERGPQIPAPSPGHQWIPGSWDHNGQRYIWKAGAWRNTPADRVWTPPHYVLGERGVLKVDGFWDRPITERGQLFAPLRVTGQQALRTSRAASLVAIDSGDLFRNLFFRKGEAELYFGNLYGPAAKAAGWLAWSATSGDGAMFDPLFQFYQSRFAERGVNLAGRLHQWERACDTFPVLRPANDLLAATARAISLADRGGSLASASSLASPYSTQEVTSMIAQAGRQQHSTLQSSQSTLRNLGSAATNGVAGTSGTGLGGLTNSGLPGGSLPSGGLTTNGLSGGLSPGGLPGNGITGGITSGLSGGLSGGGLTSGLS